MKLPLKEKRFLYRALAIFIICLGIISVICIIYYIPFSSSCPPPLPPPSLPIIHTPLSSIKPHYRIIVLVLASVGSTYFDQARQVWHLYAHLHPDIKVFMTYGHNPTPTHINTTFELVYPDIQEGYWPGMITKTIRAMQYIDTHYTYDFFLRTNISTFWDWFKLLQHLLILPLQNCYSGDGPFQNEYVSGTDMIVNGYMIKEFLKHTDKIIHINDAEDKMMGRIFHTIMGAPFLPNRIHFMENFPKNVVRTTIQTSILDGMIQHKDHYRVKNVGSNDRTNVDGIVYSELLSIIYGIKWP